MAQKLYTEEQVMKIIFTTKQWSNLSNDYLIACVTPIELPSDEEIEEVSDTRLLYTNDNSANFRLGAKWMRDKILNK